MSHRGTHATPRFPIRQMGKQFRLKTVHSRTTSGATPASREAREALEGGTDIQALDADGLAPLHIVAAGQPGPGGNAPAA